MTKKTILVKKQGPDKPVPEDQCMHDGVPSYNPSTMIMTTVEGEKWAICLVCRIGWDKENYIKEKHTTFGEIKMEVY